MISYSPGKKTLLNLFKWECYNKFAKIIIFKMTKTIILTGTCGSGKTTISKLLASKLDWIRISEDDIWKQCFGKDRGIFGSDEHRKKRQFVHNIVFNEILVFTKEGKFIVIDGTVHESPPEAYDDYCQFFQIHRISWQLFILHPTLNIAIQRDSQRVDWVAGLKRVEQLYLKFNGLIFPKECFIDNSYETPIQTFDRIVQIFKSNKSDSS